MHMPVRIGALLSVVVASIACGEAVPDVSGVTDRGDILGAITQELRAELDSGGRFVQHEISSPVTISPARALELADLFRHTVGRGLENVVETQHGEQLDFNALTPEPRVLLAESPYFVPSDAPQPVRNAHSAYYIVQFRRLSGELAMSVAVSAVTDVNVVNGRLRFPAEFGNEFFVMGIPKGGGVGLPMTPEHAALVAHGLTGARVAEAPRLILLGRSDTRARGAPQHAMWRIRFDREVEFTDRAATRRARSLELFLWRDRLTMVPAQSQRGSLTVHYRRPDGAVISTLLTRKPDYPVDFEHVVARRTR